MVFISIFISNSLFLSDMGNLWFLICLKLICWDSWKNVWMRYKKIFFQIW